MNPIDTVNRQSSTADPIHPRNLFIAIPRTGCVAVGQLSWPVINGHATAEQILEKRGAPAFWHAFKFAFVRHPLERFVSIYHYFAQMQETALWYAANRPLAETMRGYASFRDCCLRFIEDRTYTYYHLLPQARYVLIQGKLAVDYLGRTETLQQDVAEVARILGETDFAIPRVNESQHGAWEEYYDDETREIVSGHYAGDFELLKMTGLAPNAVVPADVRAGLRDRAKDPEWVI